MKEAGLIKYISKYLKERGIFFVRNVGSMYMRVGLPDFIICLGGLFIAIEVKGGKGKLSGIQSKVLSEVVNSGGMGYVVRSVEDFLRVMDNVKAYLEPEAIRVYNE